MKKSKILSLVLALAMSLSLVPSVATATDNVIYAENFDGKSTADLKAQGYYISDDDSRIVIEDGKAIAKTSQGGSGFNFDFLSAEAEGLVRVKYDVKLFNNAFDVNKSLLKTDKGNLPLIFFGAYGAIAQDYSTSSWSATLNPVSGVGYGTHWYNVDLLLDFDNGKITVNLKNLDDGTMTIENLVWDYDTLKSVSTIKGIDTYGWTHGNVADTGYDNLLFEYATDAETPDTPDKPEFNATIYKEVFDGKDLASIGKIEGSGIAISDGVVVWPADKSAGGFWFNNLDAKVADAPLGKIRVKFEMNSPETTTGATKVALKAAGGDVPLISYGVWGCLRQTQQGDEFKRNDTTPSYIPDVWHMNDIVLDFTNNKIIYNVYELENGSYKMENFEYDYDLSKVTAIQGLDFYGWAGASMVDNIVMEYVPAEPKAIEIEAVDMTGYEGGMAWDVVVNEFDGEKTYTANFADDGEVMSGKIDFSNVEADGGSVAFAIFLHTSRANVALDVVAQ